MRNRYKIQVFTSNSPLTLFGTQRQEHCNIREAGIVETSKNKAPRNNCSQNHCHPKS